MELIKNQISGVEQSIRNRSQIDQKMKPRWGWLLASIFHGFSSILKQVGAKLALKIDQKFEPKNH